MQRGALTISIDLELAWGVWDHLTPDDLHMAETAERSICSALIELFDRYDVPATWAIVAALLDEKSAASHPGPVACWYAPDIIEELVRAKVRHEIGSHGGRHVYFDSISAAQAREDLEFAGDMHRTHALAFKSFVFPRNWVGHLDQLAGSGLRTFRGPDDGWADAVGRFGGPLRRAANLIDKALPLPPQLVSATPRDALVDIPGSMLLMGRNGVRRFVLPQVTRAKLAAGLERAKRSGQIFHVWFHPSNFYYRRDEQLATLAWFLDRAANDASRGVLEIRMMGSFARN
jgi:peptidoglycan/xylan/chitin deacetylase (PgdA/CDA1 family)